MKIIRIPLFLFKVIIKDIVNDLWSNDILLIY